MQYKVLFVDHDSRTTDAYEQAFIKEPFETQCAASATEALEILETGGFGVVVFDGNLDDMTGLDFMAAARKKDSRLAGIMLLDQSGMDSAVQAIENGEIFRFMAKPCNETDLAMTIRQALYQRDLIAENRRLLQISKQQFDIIKRLGQETKGIFDLQKSQSGSIILDDPGDLNDLIKELSEEIDRYESRLINRP